MILYHFTNTLHIQAIISLGLLYAVESDLSITEQFAAPSCVWLTTDPEPSGKHGLNTGSTDKEAVRITIEVPDDEVFVWSEWATENDMKSKWRRVLTDIAGGRRVTDTWRLVFRPVPSSEWLKAENLRTGETYDLSGAGCVYDQEFFDFTQAFVPKAVKNLVQRMRMGFAAVLSESDIRAYLVKQFTRQSTRCPQAEQEYGEWLLKTGFVSYVLDNVNCGLLPLGHFTTGTTATPFKSERVVINRKMVA